MTWAIVGALAAVLGAVGGIMFKLYKVDSNQGERLAQLEGQMEMVMHALSRKTYWEDELYN